MIEPIDGGVAITIKAVPGASRDAIAGRIGNALKVRIAAPPEGGKANQAIRKLLSRRLGVALSDVELLAGATRAHKRIAVRRITVERARRLLEPG